MADEKVIAELLIKLKADVKDAKAVLGELHREVEKTEGVFAKAFGFIKKNWMELLATFAAFRGTIHFLDIAAEAEMVEESFHNVSKSIGVDGDALIAKMSEVGEVFVEQTGLMVKAQRLLVEGFTPDQIIQMMEAARVGARLMATTVEGAFGRISEAVIRGVTRPIRDAFPMEQEKVVERFAEKVGISADKLSEYGRKSAILAEITKMTQERTELLGGALHPTLSEKMQKSRSAMEEFKETVGKGLVASLTIVGASAKGLAAAIMAVVSGAAKLAQYQAKLNPFASKETVEDFRITAEAAWDSSMKLGQEAGDLLKEGWEGLSKTAEDAAAKTVAAAGKAGKDIADKLGGDVSRKVISDYEKMSAALVKTQVDMGAKLGAEAARSAEQRAKLTESVETKLVIDQARLTEEEKTRIQQEAADDRIRTIETLAEKEVNAVNATEQKLLFIMAGRSEKMREVQQESANRRVQIYSAAQQKIASMLDASLQKEEQLAAKSRELALKYYDTVRTNAEKLADLEDKRVKKDAFGKEVQLTAAEKARKEKEREYALEQRALERIALAEQALVEKDYARTETLAKEAETIAGGIKDIETQLDVTRKVADLTEQSQYDQMKNADEIGKKQAEQTADYIAKLNVINALVEKLQKTLLDIQAKPIDIEMKLVMTERDRRFIEEVYKAPGGFSPEFSVGPTVVEEEEGGRWGGEVVRAMAPGGQIPGYGGGDTVRLMAEPGEYVFRKEAVRAIKAQFGGDFLDRWNRTLRVPQVQGEGVQSAEAVRMMRFELTFPGGKTVRAAAFGDDSLTLEQIDRSLRRAARVRTL